MCWGGLVTIWSGRFNCFASSLKLSIVLETCVILCLLFVPQSRVRRNRRSLSRGVTRVIERVAPQRPCQWASRRRRRAALWLPLPHPLPRADARCSAEVPELRAVAPGPVRGLPPPADLNTGRTLHAFVSVGRTWQCPFSRSV